MGKKKEKWKTLSSEEVFSTPWMSIYHNLFEMNNGERGNYFFLHTGGSALTVAVTDEGKILLVKRYRYLSDGIALEFPCVGIKDGKRDSDAARSELIEETGYDCGKMKKVGRFMPYTGRSDEYCSVFVAKKLSHVGSAPDATEKTEVVEVTPAEIDRMIEKGRIVDGITIASWKIARKHI